MVLGYDEKRPTREDYEDFEQKLVSGLEGLGIEGLSLMFYGSYAHGNYDPGRSDMDAVLIFPDDVVVDKENLHKTSLVVAKAINGINIPIQGSILDLGTAEDGRFCSYEKSFQDYFNENGKVMVGPDYRPRFNFVFPSTIEQRSLAFNLNKIRGNLVFSEHNRTQNYKAFVQTFDDSISRVVRAPRKINYLINQNFTPGKYSVMDFIQEIFPNINLEPIFRIKGLHKNLSELDALYHKPDEMLALWNDSLTTLEEMIKAYIEFNPSTHQLDPI